MRVGPETVLPPSVRGSVSSWLIAVAAGVLETLIHALTSEDYNAAVQFSIRAVVYVLATAVILQLRRGRGWARIFLTVMLGGIGLVSLLVEPLTWWTAGGSPAAFVAAADASTRTVILVRAVHVIAVLVALALMYRPSANRYFRSRRG